MREGGREGGETEGENEAGTKEEGEGGEGNTNGN